MKKVYKKRGCFWGNRKHLGQIKSLLRQGLTLARIGLVFGVTRQGISNVCRRHGIDAEALRLKKAR